MPMGGVTWLGRGNFHLQLGAAMKPDQQACGMVLMA